MVNCKLYIEIFMAMLDFFFNFSQILLLIQMFENYNVELSTLPQIFEKIQHIVQIELLDLTSDCFTALVFHCESGKYRTTTGMAIAAIYYCNYKVS